MTFRPSLADLGVPPDYGKDPYIPAYAEAADLVDVEPNIVGRMQRLTPKTAHDWLSMKHAAFAAGVELLLVSGFRSVARQTELFVGKLETGQTIDEILKVNAAPGYSEHHTGKAVDVATPGCRPLTDEFERSRAFEWLTSNASYFGFSMPYGRGNSYGFCYEPWHWSQLDL